VFRVLARKLEEKKPPGSAVHVWENSIKMTLQEVGWRMVTGFI
jgi:hypothetical protein